MSNVMYSMMKEELEETADVVKMVVAAQLVKDELLDFDIADNWCSTHGVRVAKKSIFRTLSNLWKKEKEQNGVIFQVVNIDIE